jgi:sugar lactone lactonase YvrE
MRLTERRVAMLVAAIFAVPAYPQGIIRTLVGTDWVFPSDGKPAATAPLGQVSGIASDAKGNVFFTDEDNHLVMRIGTDGGLRVVAGNGIKGFSGDTGSAVNASLNGPQGIAVSLDGSLYFADSGNQRIRKVTPEGMIFTVAGNGRAGYSGDGGLGVNAAIKLQTSLTGMAVDGAGNLYFAGSSGILVA